MQTAPDPTLARAFRPEYLAYHGVLPLRRAELDRRIGEYPASGFVASIQRPDLELYRVALLEPEPAGRTLMVTVLYRPREEPR